MTIPNVNTKGMHMFWEVNPILFDAESLAKFLKYNYGIGVQVDVQINSFILNPPVTNDWNTVKGALNTIADILDPPRLDNYRVDENQYCHIG